MDKNCWILCQKEFRRMFGQAHCQKISVQDGDKEYMINSYLEEVKRSLLLNITHYEKSDTFMRSETNEDVIDDIQEA
ncbi:hypothetical protein H5410_030833 [Solanum commersonii]|uniref:Uncharacterized protein n=1 Tax=Solanum commersonii TaxID=4109 RepID=A0A9J5YI36_SOLCO|nr:hypothetical protein H5410_030833 [Solanum commersonii]